MEFTTLLRLSRPGWWLSTIWVYLAPTSPAQAQRAPFWVGLLFCTLPLNLLTYGMNDYVDVEVDKNNTRKGNMLYGAKCSQQELRFLPHYTAAILAGSMAVVHATVVSDEVTAPGLASGALLWLWLLAAIVINACYNLEPLHLSSKAPFEFPCSISGYSSVLIFSCLVNNTSWPPLGTVLHTVCLVGRTQLWTEIFDIEEDGKNGRRTSAVVLGKTLSLVGAMAFIVAELVVTFTLFDDWFLQGFSAFGAVVFVIMECLGVADILGDHDRKSAIVSQTFMGLLVLIYLWTHCVFCADDVAATGCAAPVAPA